MAEDLEKYYQDLYEREKEKNEQLAYRLSASQREVEDLTRKLDKIKGSIFWKLAKPARVVINYCIATKNRILCHGNPKGIAHKLLSKYREKKAIRIHGTGSFPSVAEREKEETTVFPKDVTFSILVPLYNTPERFLREMIESVTAQTYGKWELCLADGSDDAHDFVGRICQEYRQKDSRIKYQKLVKMRVFPGIQMNVIKWQQEIILHCLIMMICCIHVFCLPICRQSVKKMRIIFTVTKQPLRETASII